MPKRCHVSIPKAVSTGALECLAAVLLRETLAHPYRQRGHQAATDELQRQRARQNALADPVPAGDEPPHPAKLTNHLGTYLPEGTK